MDLADLLPKTLDLIGLRCPLPVLKARKALAMLAPGAVIAVISDDPLAAVDIPNAVRESGDAVVAVEPLPTGRRFVIRRGAAI